MPQFAPFLHSDRHNIMVMDNRTGYQGANYADANDNKSSIIKVNNYQDQDVIPYSVIILKGVISRLSPNINKPNQVKCTVSSNKETKSFWDVINGEFKILIELTSGDNKVKLEYSDLSCSLLLKYMPRKTNLRVTPVYIICQGHDGSFQSPPEVDNCSKSACSRISLGAKLIQCVVAEKLYESGFGRKTFQLEHEVDPTKPQCIIFHSNLNVNKARKMKENELWTHVGRELMLSELGSNERKFLAFLSCTRFKGMDTDTNLTHEQIISLTEAHAALGGGGLALFGSACLYTWPSSIDQVIEKFQDSTPVNTRRFMDDSGYRGTFGGCFATTLGSVCHELGHTFDLGHTKDGIMGRGFDNFDRVFLIGEQKSLRKDNMNNLSNNSVLHSTVALQRNISVTINVPEPIRMLGPRSKTTLGNFASSVVRRGPNVTTITRPTSLYLSMANSKTSESRHPFEKTTKDSIFWTQNCAVFLNYHRWFNNEYGREREVITRYLKFDKNKMMIISTAGVRVVEVREEDTGMVIDSYEFIKMPEKRFLLPFTFSPRNKVLVIVVEDDLGNVLKQAFSY